MTQFKAITLVVDDKESVRTVLQRTLEHAGYQALTAASGREALATMFQAKIEVMLLDLRMPDMSGLDVLIRVHAEHPDTAVIMVTGVTDVGTAVEAMKAGAYDYLNKPFKLDEVTLRVEKALERRQLELQVRHHSRDLDLKLKEQTRQTREQFGELIQSLAREHTLALQVDSLSRPKGKKNRSSSLPPELQQSMTTVQEFAQALIRVIHSGSLEQGQQT